MVIIHESLCSELTAQAWRHMVPTKIDCFKATQKSGHIWVQYLVENIHAPATYFRIRVHSVYVLYGNSTPRFLVRSLRSIMRSQSWTNKFIQINRCKSPFRVPWRLLLVWNIAMRDTSRTLGKSLQDDKISNIYLPAKNTLLKAVKRNCFFPPFRSQQRIISQNPLFRGMKIMVKQQRNDHPLAPHTSDDPSCSAHESVQWRTGRWSHASKPSRPKRCLQVESVEETQQQPITTTTNNDNNNKFSLNSPTYWHPGGTSFFQLHEPQSIPQKKINAFSEGVKLPPGFTKICSNLKPRS